MPPIPPQHGSRGGLITAVVVFVILWLVSTVFYFQQRGLTQQAENNVKAVEARYKGVAPTDVTSAAVTTAREAAEAGKYGVDNALDLIAHERDMLAKQVTGQAGVSADTALRFAQGAINESQDLLKGAKITPGERGVAATQNDGLAPALRKFANGYVALDTQKRASDKATADAKQANAALQQQHQQAIQSKDAEIRKVQDELAARQRDLEGLQTAQKQALTEVGTNTSTQLNQLNEQVKSAESNLTLLNQKIEALQNENKGLKGKLSAYRLDPRDNMVRRPDGAITTVPGDGTCYINIGQAKGVPVGTTFEVYDKAIGIPSLNADIAGLDADAARRTKDATNRLALAAAGAGGVAAAPASSDRYETAMPTGFKGSIEVIHVMPGNTAQCRIIKIEKGEQLRVGDLVGNLVFNPNVKFKFVVFGEFDLDYNGVPTTTDTGTVRRLITQWGGQIGQATAAAEIGPDVDFVVLGIRPEVPVLTPDEANDPIQQQRVEAAKAAQQKYNDVLDRAREYSIPVLNQTRFLYYTGYFDQRTR